MDIRPSFVADCGAVKAGSQAIVRSTIRHSPVASQFNADADVNKPFDSDDWLFSLGPRTDRRVPLCLLLQAERVSGMTASLRRASRRWGYCHIGRSTDMQGIKNYVVGAVGAAFFIALGSLLTHNSLSAAPPAKSTASARLYFLTPSTFAGNGAPNQCATGYHMASFAELSDLSSLTYNSTLGRTAADDGAGPPEGVTAEATAVGWVRSGHADKAINEAGANCHLWTSSSGSDYGSIAAAGSVGTRDSTIFFGQTTCDGLFQGSPGVWCIQD